jgi:hypothetical protein
LLFLVFGLFPIVFSFVLMFHMWDPVQGLSSMKYVGLENLMFAIEDPLVWTSLGNTLWLAVASGLPQHLVAIPLAYLINEKLGRWRNAAMGAYFHAEKHNHGGDRHHVQHLVFNRLRHGQRRFGRNGPMAMAECRHAREKHRLVGQP